MHFDWQRLFGAEHMVPPAQRLGDMPATGDAYGSVARIALPSIAEMVLMSLISSVDTVMVGQLGKNALAAVALPGQPRMIMMCIFFGLNVGVTAIVARRKGENRRADANGTLRNALMLVAALSLIIMAFALYFAEPLMRLAGGNVRTADDAEVLRDAVGYFRIMAYGLPVTVLSMCINASLRGVGNTKITMQVNIVSNLVNVAFNYLLIGGNLGFPRLGVRGAAIASVIGITAGAALSFLTVMGRGTAYLSIAGGGSWKPDAAAMRGIIKVGGNAVIEQLSMRFGFFTFSRIMYGYGVTLFAAHNIAMQFINLTFSFADGTAVAATSLAGQCLGAKRPDLSLLYVRVCQRIAFAISILIGAVLVVFRYPLCAVFIDAGTHNAAAVIEAAARTMLVVALIQPFQMAAVVLSGGLRGAGDNLYVAAVMGVCVSIIRPAMAVLAVYVLKLDLTMAWLLSLSEIAVRFYFFTVRFAGGKWKEKRV